MEQIPPSQLLFTTERSTPLGRLTRAGILSKISASGFRSMRVMGKYAIVYLLEGSGFYRDANGVRCDVSAGDLLLIVPELAHRYGPRRGEIWSEIYVVFDGPIFDLWRERGLLDSSRPVTHLAPIEPWFDRIRNALVIPRPKTPSQACLEVSAFAHLLTEIYAPHLDGINTHNGDGWLETARYLLESNLEKPLDLAAVARECGLSYESFRKRFAAVTGISPARYRAQKRIDAARVLLDHPNMTIKSVAADLGFRDEFHFSKRFKQLTGETPRSHQLRHEKLSQQHPSHI